MLAEYLIVVSVQTVEDKEWGGQEGGTEMLWDDWEMHKFLFINSVYFKILPTGTLGADIKIKIENILGQAHRGCKLAWDFPWLPANPAAFTPAALRCSQLRQIKSAPPLQLILQGERGREKEMRSLRYL